MRSDKRGVRRRHGEVADLVMQELAKIDRPVSGLELAKDLARKRSPIWPSQVYRSLAQLVKTGRVLKIASLSAYMIAPNLPSIVLICSGCGKHSLLSGRRAQKDCEQLSARNNFVPHRFFLEVNGRCKNCRQ